MIRITRRHALGGLAAVATLPTTRLFAQTKLALPTSPVALNIADVAGNLALTQTAIENYAKAKPELVSKITFTKAPAPELPGKIKAQQAAGRLDIDMVLTGTDALSAGIDMDLWTKLLPDHSASLPDLASIYLEPAHRMLALGKYYGVIVTYYPSGPLLEYMPDRVKKVPTTAD